MEQNTPPNIFFLCMTQDTGHGFIVGVAQAVCPRGEVSQNLSNIVPEYVAHGSASQPLLSRLGFQANKARVIFPHTPTAEYLNTRNRRPAQTKKSVL